MPYRGATGPRIPCAAHDAAEAVGCCSRCRVALCDPCTLYFAAAPYCRVCIRGARRASKARIVGGVTAVMLTMTLVTGVMLSAIPMRVHARGMLAPVRHPENCRLYDQWIAEARRDLEHGRPRGALHELALSRRDCGEDAERDRLEAFAYDAVGDKFAAIAAASRWLDATQDDRAQQLLDELTH